MRTKQALRVSYAGLAGITTIAGLVEVPVWIQMLACTIFTIYIGCHRSLDQNEVDPVTGQAQQAESLSSKDAYMFPVIGSAVLFSLYILFKVFSKEYINFLLTAYFFVLGVLACTTTLSPLLRGFFTKAAQEKVHQIHFQVPLNLMKDPVDWKFTAVDVVAFIISTVIGVCYVTTKHWCVHNIFGFSFSVQGIEHLSLGSFKVGCILLGGLFFYDIFWVFGTDVMVTVAKSFDAPIKLLFPKAITDPMQFSMLGLGDIVIPGIFVALCLRYDAHRAEVSGSNRDEKDKKLGADFPKPYFNACFIGYILGLAATIIVMFIFQHAQPALLYLVPGCLGSVFLTAVVRGEVSQLMAFDESPNNEKDKTKTVPEDSTKSN